MKHLEVPYTDEERKAHRDPAVSTPNCASSSAASDGERFATEFVLKLLKKRLFSSPAAFAITLEKHIAHRRRPARLASTAASETSRTIDDDYADDEEYEAETGEVVGSASQACRAISAEEKALLQAAQRIRGQGQPASR